MIGANELIADAICREVAELPDRNSPADWPEAMLVTHDELRDIVLSAIRAFQPEQACPKCNGNRKDEPCAYPEACHYTKPAQAVAWVPVHPRNGPLWAMTTDSPNAERLPSYPLKPLYDGPQPEQAGAAVIVARRMGNWVAIDTTPQPEQAGSEAVTFQSRVQPWMMTCFGPKISADTIERNHRFIEEALELVQACGMTQTEAHQLVDYVFGRPAGDPPQEVGGVMVTLAALCLAHGMDMHDAGEVELRRIWTKIEKIRAKQAAKPSHSPLPAHQQPHPVNEETSSALASLLIDAWVADKGRQIPWAKAVQIVAIVTKQTPKEMNHLLRMGDDDDGKCGMCGRSDAQPAGGRE